MKSIATILVPCATIFFAALLVSGCGVEVEHTISTEDSVETTVGGEHGTSGEHGSDDHDSGK